MMSDGSKGEIKYRKLSTAEDPETQSKNVNDKDDGDNDGNESLTMAEESDEDEDGMYFRRAQDRNNNSNKDGSTDSEQWISDFELNKDIQPYTSLLSKAKRGKTSTAGHWKYIMVFMMMLFFVRYAFK